MRSGHTPTDDETTGGRNGIQVIARAARILRALKDCPSGLSLAQLAESAALPRSTAQRIVAALQSEDLVTVADRGGRIRLGPGIGELAVAARFDVVESCRLLLNELSRTTGETVDLSVLRGPAMIFLDQVPGIHRLRAVSRVGEAFPLTTTANGRACLALLPVEEACRLAREEWDRLGVSGDLSRLVDMLDEVRATGLAYDLDEHTVGISAVGFAFRDRAGVPHAISVPIPSTRFPAVRPTVEAALRRTAAHVAKLMERDDAGGPARTGAKP
jgi:DNA-binding IclR family transcriptional regulator